MRTAAGAKYNRIRSWHLWQLAPIANVVGPDTGLPAYSNLPWGIAADAQGNFYFSDLTRLLVFAAGSNGDVPPSAIITGDKTGLTGSSNVAVDQQGNIYATDTGSNSIIEYKAGSAGNISPISVIRGNLTNLSIPQAIAVQPPPLSPHS